MHNFQFEVAKVQNVKKLGLGEFRIRIVWVEAQCPNHITNASERVQAQKLDDE